MFKVFLSFNKKSIVLIDKSKSERHYGSRTSVTFTSDVINLLKELIPNCQTISGHFFGNIVWNLIFV